MSLAPEWRWLYLPWQIRGETACELGSRCACSPAFWPEMPCSLLDTVQGQVGSTGSNAGSERANSNFSPWSLRPWLLALVPLNPRLLGSLVPQRLRLWCFHWGFAHSSPPYMVCLSSSRVVDTFLFVQPSDGPFSSFLPFSFFIV